MSLSVHLATQLIRLRIFVSLFWQKIHVKVVNICLWYLQQSGFVFLKMRPAWLYFWFCACIFFRLNFLINCWYPTNVDYYYRLEYRGPWSIHYMEVYIGGLWIVEHFYNFFFDIPPENIFTFSKIREDKSLSWISQLMHPFYVFL